MSGNLNIFNAEQISFNDSKTELGTDKSRIRITDSNMFTFDSNVIIPFFLREFMPNEVANITSQIGIRQTTPIVPSLSNIYAEVYYFYVPYTAIWDGWRNFRSGETINSYDEPNTTLMTPNVEITPAKATDNSLAGYMGIPVGRIRQTNKSLMVNSLPFRAYQSIYNQFFRDQAIYNEGVNKWTRKNQEDDTTKELILNIRTAYKKKDKFTSLFLEPQYGDPTQVIALKDLSVVSNGQRMVFRQMDDLTNLQKAYGKEEYESPALLEIKSAFIPNSTAPDFKLTETIKVGRERVTETNEDKPTGTEYAGIGFSWHQTGLKVDGESALFYRTLLLAGQEYKEKLLHQITGTRYKEWLKGFYGVDYNDSQYNPTFIGKYSVPIVANPIAQTSETGSTPQGNLGAVSLGNGGKGLQNFVIKDYGYIMGLVVVRGDTNYYQGIPKAFQRSVKTDYHDPLFNDIGEVPVYGKDIYYTGNPAEDNKIFGWQNNNWEYTHSDRRVSGKLTPDAEGSLAIWTTTQQFDEKPQLNYNFLYSNLPIKRNQAITSEPEFIATIETEIIADRVMPIISTPDIDTI